MKDDIHNCLGRRAWPTIIFKHLNMITAKESITNIYQTQTELCHALSHPVRLAILDILRDGEQCVCHIEAMLGLRQAYISQHLIVLRDAGLVEDRRDGWNNYYRVSQSKIYKVTDAINALTGRPRQKIDQVHTRAECPCPKCNA